MIMRRVRERGLSLVACAALVVGMVAAAALVLAPAASAATCPAYEFIGARGTNEDVNPNYSTGDLGMGAVVNKVYQLLAARLPAGTMTGYGVHYEVSQPAGSVGALLDGLAALLGIEDPFTYQARVDKGKSDIVQRIESEHVLCGSTRFILVGYSQGADTTGGALLTGLTSADRALVAAVALFGDPYFNPDDTAADTGGFDPNYYGAFGLRNKFSTVYSGPVISYCNAYDHMCNLTRKLDAGASPLVILANDVNNYLRIVVHAAALGQPFYQAHLSYATTGSSVDPATAAANWLATRLGH
jgi:cutinase